MTITGTTLRDRGMEDVLAADCAAHRNYGELCREVLDDLIESGISFTAETIRQRVAEQHPEAVAHHANVLPAVIGGAARTERIAPVGITRAARRSRHAGRILVWRAA